MADDATTPWYMNLGTWINIVQGILGLLVAAGGAGIGIEHAAGVEPSNIAAGLSITGLGAAHQIRAVRGATTLPKRKVGDM